MTAARPGVCGIVIWRAEMEKLDKVIAGLECCGRPNPMNCFECPYRDDEVCQDTMYQDTLDLLKDMKIAVTAAGVLERYRPAFEALAKGEE